MMLFVRESDEKTSSKASNVQVYARTFTLFIYICMCVCLLIEETVTEHEMIETDSRLGAYRDKLEV